MLEVIEERRKGLLNAIEESELALIDSNVAWNQILGEHIPSDSGRDIRGYLSDFKNISEDGTICLQNSINWMKFYLSMVREHDNLFTIPEVVDEISHLSECMRASYRHLIVSSLNNGTF